MSARRCFVRKINDRRVSQRAGAKILDMMNRFEEGYQSTLGDGAAQRQATLDAAEHAAADAARRRVELQSTIVAQANVMRAVEGFDARIKALRETPGDLGFGNKAPPTLGKDNQTTLGGAVRSLLARDPFEISTWSNAHYLARNIRAKAHATFAEAIDYLRPKRLGFAQEKTRELDVLRALYGQTPEQAMAGDVAKAWSEVAADLADQFIGAHGKLAKREDWRLPNPEIDQAKVRAIGPDRFKELVRENVDRQAMLDYDTGKPLSDVRFEQLLDEATQGFLSGFVEGAPTGAARGRRMLANSRDFGRFFVWKDAESWISIAEAVGAHASVFETMVGHIQGMSDDIAMLRIFGANPETTKRFILDLFDRETAKLSVTDPANPGKATRTNRGIEARVGLERRLFEDLWSEVTGANRIPVNTALATTMGDARHWLSATQLGSAIISSFTDPASMALAARFNGLPVMGVISRATSMMAEKGAEIFAAQQGLVLDSMAHAAGQADRVMGETIRTGFASKLSNANIRASGLRRWTAMLRAAFGLEYMAHVARERGKPFLELTPEFRDSLGRYGIGETDWDLIRGTEPHAPRENAFLSRPLDVAAGGTPAHRAAADKYQRLIDTEMDYAVIENDATTRALMIGSSQPGTLGGETRRAVTMYRSFPATFVLTHFARAFARGWDGKRLSHAALTFATMTALGALSMQSKEILAGRDPLTLDPTEANGLRAWGKAALQGGGLGVFGDVLFLDQTKYGNSWAATVAGPIAGSVERVLGDFVFKNIQLAGKGKETHFAGDALFAIGSHMPGSSLWFGRLAFQRGVLDQLALMADPRTPERFRRIEETARKEWGQSYWLPPGRTEARRAPDLSAMFGQD